MKTYLHIFFFLIVCVVLSAQTGRVSVPDGYTIFRYPNTDRISSEGLMRDGKPDGYWKSYYPTGIMSSEGNRINFMMDSTWVFYTVTGDTSEIINYRLDRRSGFRYLFETITERNRISVHYLKSKELYLDDKREGKAFYYYPSGKIRQEVNYRNGRRQGISFEYDEDGKIVTVLRFHNDFLTERQLVNRVNALGERVGAWKTFYPSGNVHEEWHYKNGVLDGMSLVKLDNERNELSYERLYREGELVEEGVPLVADMAVLNTYHDDDVTLKSRGYYLDSIPVGFHYFFDEQGIPYRAIRYSERLTGIRVQEGAVDANERLTGQWENFSEAGILRARGLYSNNAPVGQWTFFYADGKIEQIGNFLNGVRDGRWVWYYPSGEILREDHLTRGVLNGMSTQYSDSATIVAVGEYIDGEREGFWIEEVGDAREEGNYTAGLKSGVWRTYHKDGKLNHIGTFVEGVPDGKHLFYYPDGTLKEEQNYVMGRRHRNWRKYYENGNVFLTITYNNDQEIRINGMRIDNIR
jgi:antitoxin component YwqK of YwqJK toxin-antitoxin module